MQFAIHPRQIVGGTVHYGQSQNLRQLVGVSGFQQQAKLVKSEPGNGSDRKAEARESGDLYSGIDSL